MQTSHVGRKVVLAIIIGLGLTADGVLWLRWQEAQRAPLPPSPVIKSITFAPPSTIIRKAEGGDNWPVTVGDDGYIYTAFGDGWGFEPRLKNKVDLGICRISGGPTHFKGENVAVIEPPLGSRGVISIKGTGILMVNGRLYLWSRRDGGTLRESTDRGNTWRKTGISMQQPNGDFHALHFLQFGPNYQGARDRFVYVYGTNQYTANGDIFLFRVPQDKMTNRSDYRFFAGLDTTGMPIWHTDITERVPVVRDRPGRARDARAVYNPGIDRYILTYTWYDGFRNGDLAILDAPEPWGPWTTVFYTTKWALGFTFEYSFPQKWISADGKTMYMVFSGTGINDAFCVRKTTLTLFTD